MTCQPHQDGDWQVRQEDTDDSSQVTTSSEEEVKEVGVTAEVHVDDAVTSPIQQGESDHPPMNMDGLRCCDDITPLQQVMTPHPPPFLDMEDHERWVAVMTPHPPPFLTTDEQNYADEDQGHVYADDYPEVVEAYSDYSEEYVHADNKAEDPYLAEFKAFYANYEEGADHLYYREEDDGEETDED